MKCRFVCKAATSGRAAAHEGVEDEVAFVGGRQQNALDEGYGLLRRMFSDPLLPWRGWRNGPDGFHLLAGVGFAHQFVVEGVARLFVFGGPDNCFGGVGEVSAGKIGRRIGLDPAHVIQQLEIELLHGEADAVNDVRGAADPNAAVGLEDALRGGEPFAIEGVIGFGALRAVPCAFIDADHAARVAGDASVGKEIGRVGEDEVHGIGGHDGENFAAVALVKLDVVRAILEERRHGDEARGLLRRAGRFSDCVVSVGLIRHE